MDAISRAKQEAGRLAEELEIFAKGDGAELGPLILECVTLALYALARASEDPAGLDSRLRRLAAHNLVQDPAALSTAWAPAQEVWAAIERMTGLWQTDPHD